MVDVVDLGGTRRTIQLTTTTHAGLDVLFVFAGYLIMCH